MDNHNHTAMPGHGIMSTDCEGNMTGGSHGTWIGHFLPGCVFIFWGFWWAYNTFTIHLWRRTSPQPRSQAWYPAPFPRLRLLEPFSKFLLPFFGMMIELYFDHLSEGFQHLYCPKGTKFEGRFAGDNMNNWQHASIYPAFILSGFVDLVSTRVAVPPGTNHAFMALAIGIEAFLMGTHEKHEPQDKMVHWLLFVTMLLCLVFVILEIHAPYNPLPGFGKSASFILQGAWLIQISKVGYGHLPQWEPTYGGGTMMAPAVFCLITVLIMVCMTCFYLALAALWQVGAVPPCLVSESPAYAQPCEQTMELPERKGLLHRDPYNALNDRFSTDSAKGGSSGSTSPCARANNSGDGDSNFSGGPFRPLPYQDDV